VVQKEKHRLNASSLVRRVSSTRSAATVGEREHTQGLLVRSHLLP